MATKIKTHIKQSKNAQYFRDILLCCIPLLAFSYFMYGPRVLVLTGIAVATAYVCDRLLVPLHPAGYEPDSGNSVCFAVLLTLMLPATISIYILVVAVATAVLLGKEVFGGSENYPFHPMAVGYAVAAVGWPSEMFSYPRIGTLPLWDMTGVSMAESASNTLKNGGLPTTSAFNLLLGNYVGPLGTGCVIVILACAVYLLLRGDIDIATPVSFLLACAAVVWLLPRAGDLPARSLFWTHIDTRLAVLRYEILSGAIPFAAVFLITEPATRPSSRPSRILYGVLLGIMTMMFRYYGTYETGVCFAILVLNAVSDWLDVFSERVFGIKKAKVASPAKAKAKPKPKPKPKVSAPAQPAAAAAALSTDSTQVMPTLSAAEPAAKPAPEPAAEPASAPDESTDSTRVMPTLDPGTLATAAQAAQKAEQARQEAEKARKNRPGRRARRRAAAAAAAAAAQAEAQAGAPTDTAYLHTVMIPRIKEVDNDADAQQ